tara:strand:- start:69 stop:683 length:615 start_codon:yes stop_codon:yes gene_type:complete
MKKMFVIIIVSLTLSSSVLANKIFLSQSGFNFEIPNQFVQYNRDYLKDNMEKILSQADEAGLVRTEEFLLNQMTTLEKYENINQFVSENNVANSITFLLMENLNTFTDEEIKKNRDEIIKKVAEQYQIDDDAFSTFEIFTISVEGKKGHRMIHNYPYLPNFLMSDTWIEFNNENNLRIVYSNPNTDLKSFKSFIEEVEATLKFR